MEERFIKIYVLISLWFGAGMLLSAPLRKAFEDMHWRVMERIYDATWGQLVKGCKRITLYFEEQSYELRVNMARSLVSEELLEELNHRNLVAAIARARQMDQADSGVPYEELEKLVHLITGKSVGNEEKRVAVKTAFKLSDTTLLQDIITKMPKAQERILLAFEQAEGNEPYDSIKNEEYRKFIRD